MIPCATESRIILFFSLPGHKRRNSSCSCGHRELFEGSEQSLKSTYENWQRICHTDPCFFKAQRHQPHLSALRRRDSPAVWHFLADHSPCPAALRALQKFRNKFKQRFVSFTPGMSEARRPRGSFPQPPQSTGQRQPPLPWASRWESRQPGDGPPLLPRPAVPRGSTSRPERFRPRTAASTRSAPPAEEPDRPPLTRPARSAQPRPAAPPPALPAPRFPCISPVFRVNPRAAVLGPGGGRPWPALRGAPRKR